MQVDEGGGLSTSLFGNSSNGDIGIPDFKEEDYLDLSILNDAEDSNLDVGSESGKVLVRDAQSGGGAANTGVSVGQQQQTSTAHTANRGINTVGGTSLQRLPQSPTLRSHNNGPQLQGSQQQGGQEEETNSNDSDKRSDTDRSEQNESSTSTALSQTEPSKPLTDSPSTYTSSMKLPNGDGRTQASMFTAPNRDISAGSSAQPQDTSNGYRSSPTSSGQAQLHSNRPPSPSKRSPTRSGTLALIPEEEENQQQRRDQLQSQAPTNGQNSQGPHELFSKPETSRSLSSRNGPNAPSHVPNAQGSQKADDRQPSKTSIPPYVQSIGENTAKSSMTVSSGFSSAPPKVAMPGQHAQAIEVRRHLYALQIPALLLVNAELVKGCIFLLEQHAKNNPNQVFSMEGTYSELVSRLSGNLGYLATITNTGGVPNNGSLPIPILEAPAAASEYLKNLYNQLRAYFMMGQKGGTFGHPVGSKSENISSFSGQQQQRQLQAQEALSPDKQQRVAQETAENANDEPARAPKVTGKRDRLQTEQDGQEDVSAQPEAKRERTETGLPAQRGGPARVDGSSMYMKGSQDGQEDQRLDSAGLQQQVAGFPQQQVTTLQAQSESTVPAASAASTSGPQTKRRKASQDSVRSASLGASQTPRVPNQQQQHLQRLTSSTAQKGSAQDANDSSTSNQPSADQPQQQPHPQQQTSTIPPHIQQHMQAVAAANAAQAPNTSLQQQGKQFPQQQQQQPPIRAPSAMSMQSPMSQSQTGTPQHYRHPSIHPSTPALGPHASGHHLQSHNGISQPSVQPRPPGVYGLPQAAAQQGQMQGPGFQLPPAAPQQPAQQSQQGHLPENLDLLAKELMRLQSMMASARQFKLNHDLYGKMPLEAKQQLEIKLNEQENQFNQMRLVYERRINEQQQQREGEQSAQPNSQPGRRNAMSPQPSEQQMQNMSQHQQRPSLQYPSRPSQMPNMPPPHPPQQHGQRQASISSLQQQANTSTTGSPAASVHGSPAVTHASPHGMTRPGTSQSMRQGDGQMIPPSGRPVQQQVVEAGSPASHMQQQQQQRLSQYGQQANHSNDTSSPARPPSVLSNSANNQQQPHFRVPSVNAYHPGAPTNSAGSPHNMNFPSSPATSSMHAGSPAGGPHMQPPGSAGQGGFNLMQQRARMASMQGNQFARPPTPSSQQQQTQGRQATPQQTVQPLQSQHTGGPTWQQGQPGNALQQQQHLHNAGSPSAPSQQHQPGQHPSQQQQTPPGTPVQQSQTGPFPPMPPPMGMAQQQQPSQMHMLGMQGQQQPGMHIPPQLYQNPQALHAYIAHVQAQAQAQGRPPPQLPPGLQLPDMNMSPAQGMAMAGPGGSLYHQQQMQGQAVPMHAGQMAGVAPGRTLPVQAGGIPHHLFPTGFNPNNPSHHHTLQQYQQELQQQEQMQQLQRLKAHSQQQQQQGSPMPGTAVRPGAANMQPQQIHPGHPQYEAVMRQQQHMRMQQAQGQVPMTMQQQQQMRQASAVAGQVAQGSGPPQGMPVPQGSPPPQQMQQMQQGANQPVRGQPQAQVRGQAAGFPQQQGSSTGQTQGQQAFNPNMSMQARQMMPPQQQQHQQQQQQQSGPQQRPMFPYAGQGGPQGGQQQNGQAIQGQPQGQGQAQGSNGMLSMQQQQGYPSQQQQQQQQQAPTHQAQSQSSNAGQPQSQQQPGSANSIDFDSYINLQ